MSRYYPNKAIISPSFDGKTHSGRSVTVSGDGAIPVPINYDGSTVQGSVTYFDNALEEFVQEATLPLSTTYDLKDGEYGMICKLHTNSFSAEDIAAFNARAELLIEWGLGAATIPSGIVKGVDDKIFAAAETSGTTLTELSNVDTITITGTYSRSAGLNIGLQTVALDLNASEVPTNVLANKSNMQNGTASTGFKPDISAYTIQEVVAGDLADIGTTDTKKIASDMPSGVNSYHEFTWDSQTADTQVTMNKDMEFSNDGGATFNTLVAGTNVVMSSGVGPYVLKTKFALTSIRFDGAGANFNSEIVCYSSGFTSSYRMLSTLSNITTPPDLTGFDTSNVTDMRYMMYGWSNVTTPPDLTGFDTSNVTDMRYMMYGWSNVTTPPDLTGFDTSSVTSMSGMMYGWSNVTTPPDLTGFDTSSVTSMNNMMNSWPNITTPPDLTGFDTSSVTIMYSMMSGWSNVTTPPDLTGFDTSSVIDMRYMMNGWSSITTPPDLTSFDTSSVTNMTSMMNGWSSITTPPDLTSFDTSSVTSMSSMMYNWASVTTPPDLTSFDTSNVTDMRYMMMSWSNITTPPDLTSFDTSSVTNMSYMLYNWASITEIGDIGVEDFNISSLTSAGNFADGSKFAQATMDKILINWEGQPHQLNVSIHFGSSNFTLGGAAETAYNALIADGWTIDGLTGV